MRLLSSFYLFNLYLPRSQIATVRSYYSHVVFFSVCLGVRRRKTDCDANFTLEDSLAVSSTHWQLSARQYTVCSPGGHQRCRLTRQRAAHLSSSLVSSCLCVYLSIANFRRIDHCSCIIMH